MTKRNHLPILRSYIHSMSLLILCVLPMLVFGLIAGCTEAQETGEAETPQTADDQDLVSRGEYLVTVMGCNDCHTPWTMGPQGPEPDTSRMLSGHPAEMEMPPPPDLEGPWMLVGAATNTAYAGPWGTVYAYNLTPDSTGLGIWTEEMFVRALKTGWHMGIEGSRRIMPPMPQPAYSHMSGEDLRAIFAYLQTIPPIENVVPAYEPPATAGR